MKLSWLENVAVVDEEDRVVEAVEIEFRFDASDADLTSLEGVDVSEPLVAFCLADWVLVGVVVVLEGDFGSRVVWVVVLEDEELLQIEIIKD